MTTHQDLPLFELCFPGPLRDRLVAAVLSGTKTTTTGLLTEYARFDEALPVVGQLSAMPDSAGRLVAVIEVIAVEVLRLADVGLAHARAEGEGHTTVAGWRAAHEEFWHFPDVRAGLGDPEFTVDDDTMVVTERFRVAERLTNPLPG